MSDKVLTSEEWIDINYHARVDQPDLLRCDKTGEAVTYEDVAQAYAEYYHKEMVKEKISKLNNDELGNRL